ncbi:MAG: hypothetical protein M3437_11505 [Chloroflexota bacterium]|nr:hypothetical protein [Chloroflexota bacterium]MDQ5867977.1 hypothetical protein [Chloroflexota bacterium]
MRKVYDLRQDTQVIEEIQSGALDSGDFQIGSEHGPFGSSAWWRAMERGDVPIYALEGVISSVSVSGHNGYHEFEVDDGQHKSQWSGGGPGSEYVVGKLVLIEYVVERLEPTLQSAEFEELGLDKAEIVLAIWVE